MAFEIEVGQRPETALPPEAETCALPVDAATDVVERQHAVAVPRYVLARISLGAWQALTGYVLLTAIAMWPAISDISNTVMGSIQPSDATAGGVWYSWQFSLLSPFAAHTPYFGAPQGESMWLPTFMTSLGWILPMWGIAHLTNAIATWNVLVALGFVADGMAMYGLVRWLTGRRWISFLAGVLYAFSPFHVEQSYVHLAYLYSWIFPLIIWAGLALLSRPSRRQAIIFGIGVGGAAYVDGYYIIFAPVVAAVLVVLGLFGAKALRLSRRALMKNAGLAAVIAISLMVPIAFVYLTSSHTVGALFEQNQGLYTLLISSAQISRYLVPWIGSPSWARLVSSVLRVNPHFVWGDGSLYLGLVVVALGMALAAVELLRPRLTPIPGLRMPQRFVALALPASTLIVMLCSFAIFGPLPGLPRIVWAIKPFWRSYSRMDVAVDCLAVLAAATFLVRLQGGRRKWLVPALALLALVDGTAVFPWASWSYSAHLPAALSWLESHQDSGVVAGYNLEPFAAQNAYYLTFQAVDHHRLFNTGTPTPDTSRIELVRGLESLGDPQTVPTLRREGVRYIVVGRRYGSVTWRRRPVQGLRLILRSRGGSLLRIEPGALLPAALTIIRGANDQAYVLRVGHWMRKPTMVLGLDVFRRNIPLSIRFDARSYKSPPLGRMLRVYQHGSLMWQGRVNHYPRIVSFVTRSYSNLKMTVSPGSIHVGRIYYPRRFEIWHFDVTAASKSAPEVSDGT